MVRRTKKSKFKKKPARLTPLEQKFARSHLKKGSLPEFKRVLKARWWIGRMGSRK